MHAELSFDDYHCVSLQVIQVGRKEPSKFALRKCLYVQLMSFLRKKIIIVFKCVTGDLVLHSKFRYSANIQE